MATSVDTSRTGTAFLANARREAEQRGLFDTLVVDCDCHHYESALYR